MGERYCCFAFLVTKTAFRPNIFYILFCRKGMASTLFLLSFA